jgi:PKD domain-containing protein
VDLARIGALAAMLVVALLLAVAPGARAAAWLPPTDLSAPQSTVPCGTFCVQPGAGGVDVAVDAAGNAVAAWTRRDDLNNQVVQAAFRPAGGSFGPPVDLGTTSGGYFVTDLDGPLADVAMDGAGNATVVWAHPAGANSTVQVATRPAGGSFGPAVDLSAPSTSVANARIVTSRSGHTVVAWARNDGTNTIIEVTSRPPGGGFGPAQPLSVTGQNADAAAVAVNEAGAAVVAWLRFDGMNFRAQARARPAGGAFAPVQDMSAAGQPALSPDVAIDGQGRSTVVWSRPNGAGDTVVQSRGLTAAGALGPGPDDISEPGRVGFDAAVALDADNTAVAVWHDCPNTSNTGCVVVSASRASGGGFASPQPIAPVDEPAVPAVATTPAGDAIAVWVSSAIGRIQAAVRPKGGAFGEAQGISPSVGGANAPALVVDDEGSALAGWSYRLPDDRRLAQAAALDAGAPVLAAISVPDEAVTGSSIAISAQAFDRWGGTAIEWSFGDGATATGGSVSHAYAAAGAHTVTVTARDAAGNATSATRTVQVRRAAPPKRPRVSGQVVARWRVRGRRTVAKRLLVRRLKANARVQVRCRGKRCPFRVKRARRPRRGKVNLLRTLGRRRTFRFRQTVEVRITAPRLTGKVYRYKIRKGRRPASSTLCLPVGGSKPRRC